MLVGIDGVPLKEVRTGVGHYTFELARTLARDSPADQFELISPFPFVALPENADEETSTPNLRLRQVKVNVLERHWFAIGLPRYLKRNPIGLFHGTNYDVPLWRPCPTVLTIHDLSPLLYPDTHEPRRVRRARRRLPLMARIATQIITPTESVRREVIEHLHVPGDKVSVVSEAARAMFRPLPRGETVDTLRRLGIEDDFLLFVGTVEPRKNLRGLISAYQEVVRATGRRPQLVIAGKKGWLTEDLFAHLRASGLEERVHFTGYLSDVDLRCLYSSCLVFIYPSIYEGFGLPPLEAMSCGAPVITSRLASIVEVVGDAACLVKPTSVEDLTRGLTTLLADEAARRRLSLLGIERARKFSWNQTARETRSIYDRAIENVTRRPQ